MDVTSDTVEADKLLSGETATKNDGTKVTGAYAVKLQSKSVTPTESEQVVTASNGGTSISFSKSGAPTRIGTSNTGYYVEEIDTSWLDEEKTYHVSGTVSYHSYSSGTTSTCTVDSDYIYGGTFSLKNKVDVHFELISTGLKITVPIGNNQGDRNISISGELTFVDISSAYDGLKQVTVAAIPSAYLIPSGTYSISSNGTYDIGAYQSVSVSVEGSGDESYKILDRTISQYSNSTISIIGPYAFASCDQLSYISIPNAVIISDFAFVGTSLKNTVNLGNATTLGKHAFEYLTMSSINASKVTSVGAYCFNTCSRLASVRMPDVEFIGEYAFARCSSLGKITGTAYYLEYNKLKNIGSNAFTSCTALKYIECSALETIGMSAFAYDYIEKLSASKLTTVDAYAFAGVYKLSIINAPRLTSLGTGALTSTGISIASFPYLTYAGGFAFRSCSSLQTVNLPMLSIIASSMFYNCYNLSVASFNNVSEIHADAFSNCSRLLSLYLLGSSVVSFHGTAFRNTPISTNTSYTDGVYGSIYVPASLYEEYLSSWGGYSSRIVSV